MKQLVKARVTPNDPVSKLVQRELRRVSSTISLDELGRILARNKFALVEQTKFVTTSDLLKKISPPKAAAKNQVTPDEPSESNTPRGSSMITVAAASMAGMSIAALGTFLAMKHKS